MGARAIKPRNRGSSCTAVVLWQERKARARGRRGVDFRLESSCEKIGNKLGSVSIQECMDMKFSTTEGQSVKGDPILIKELPAIGDTHNGGVFAKGQNNELYFVIGDNEHVSDFQNFPSEITRETSSIFKIHTDDDNRVELFAMGIRNSFGLDVDPITGHLWQTENGVTEYDEINLVKPGFNSGWRILMGPADRDWLWNIDKNPDRIFSTSIEHDEVIYQIVPQSFKNFVCIFFFKPLTLI